MLFGNREQFANARARLSALPEDQVAVLIKNPLRRIELSPAHDPLHRINDCLGLVSGYEMA